MGCFCCGDHPDEACGYPPKTIRATLSLITVVIGLLIEGFLVVYFATTGEGTNAMGVIGIISTEVGAVIAFYFGSRSDQEMKKVTDDIALEVEDGMDKIVQMEAGILKERTNRRRNKR